MNRITPSFVFARYDTSVSPYGTLKSVKKREPHYFCDRLCIQGFSSYPLTKYITLVFVKT